MIEITLTPTCSTVIQADDALITVILLPEHCKAIKRIQLVYS